jgi:predicted NUDIX family NTP pyrophosphohydrolase
MAGWSIIVSQTGHKEDRVPQISAGILLYRCCARGVEVFLIHMGGPFWAHKDAGAWSIPKGLIAEGEDPLAAALREFAEETGQSLGDVNGRTHPLAPIRQAGGKIVQAWAVEGDADAEHIVSNEFRVELPPGSGRWRSYPEADRAAWFTLAEAEQKIVAGQRGLLAQVATFAC